jgi:hypothetical protein
LSVIIIIVSVLTGTAFITTLAIALGRAAAHADDELDSMLERDRSAGMLAARRQSYAGFASDQATISGEPSITLPSSSTSVGTQRFPVSSCTSRRPRVWLNTPGSGAKP